MCVAGWLVLVGSHVKSTLESRRLGGSLDECPPLLGVRWLTRVRAESGCFQFAGFFLQALNGGVGRAWKLGKAWGRSQSPFAGTHREDNSDFYFFSCNPGRIRKPGFGGIRGLPGALPKANVS